MRMRMRLPGVPLPSYQSSSGLIDRVLDPDHDGGDGVGGPLDLVVQGLVRRVLPGHVGVHADLRIDAVRRRLLQSPDVGDPGDGRAQ